MTAWLFVLVCLAGGLGAGVRFVVDGALRSRMTTLLSWPTAIINLSGSLTLGVLTGMVAAGTASTAVGAVVGAGFLGGYTTFSTASFETVQLIREQRYGAAFVHGFGVLVASVALAFVGYGWGCTA